jgi:hypothetical protein
MWRWSPTAARHDTVVALFQQSGDNAARAAVLLETLLKDWWARREIAAEIRALETQAHRTLHAALASLFAPETDASLVLRWKELRFARERRGQLRGGRADSRDDPSHELPLATHARTRGAAALRRG